MTRPRSTIATASQVRSTSSSRCDDSITVRPSSARLTIIARISCIPAGSSPFIGSSRISSSGSPSRHEATPRRWRMPIEYLATLSSARSVRPTRSNDGAIRFAASPPRAAASRRRLSRPVRWGWNRGSSTIAPTRARARLLLGRDRDPEQRHRAAVGPGQAEQGADQRGLARAVRPEVTERVPARDPQFDVVDRDVGPEPLDQAVGLHRPPVGRALEGDAGAGRASRRGLVSPLRAASGGAGDTVGTGGPAGPGGAACRGGPGGEDEAGGGSRRPHWSSCCVVCRPRRMRDTPKASPPSTRSARRITPK